VVVPHAGPAGIQCRKGHDPASPLCHVCLDGAPLQNLPARVLHHGHPCHRANVTGHADRVDGIWRPVVHRVR
jgi:hypothetical protein